MKIILFLIDLYDVENLFDVLKMFFYEFSYFLKVVLYTDTRSLSLSLSVSLSLFFFLGDQFGFSKPRSMIN